MNDCTEAVLRGEYDEVMDQVGEVDVGEEDVESDAEGEGDGESEGESDGDHDLPESKIVIDMLALKQRPKLKEAILECLDPTGNKKISDELLIEMINTFPDVRQEFNKLFYGLHEFDEREGNPTYYPSILDVTDADEILKISEVGGFRELNDEIPHKYAHLSKESIDIIYGNPRIRTVVSRMTADKITDDLVSSMSG